MTRALVLVGMMGAGKTTVGRRLAEITGREFHDTDSMLQFRLGRSIPQIFSLYGEAAFRDHEHAVLTELEPGPYVLATGGGIVLRDDNWAELRRLGPSLYLRAPAEEIIRRLDVSRRKRPLLDHDDWQDRVRELLKARQARYEMADHTLDVGEEEVETVADRALALFQAGGHA